MQKLADRIAAYAAHRMPNASDVVASHVDRIHGGASRETYRFRLRHREGGREFERRLILRRDPRGTAATPAREPVSYQRGRCPLFTVGREVLLAISSPGGKQCPALTHFR
jgi:hypothetical protein